MLPARVVRRTVSLLLLVAAQAWQLEAPAGAARDGAVHHEPASAAATHTGVSAGVSTGDHGHEDGLPPGQHRHGSQHQHGTLADHCSHAHGLTALTAVDLAFPARTALLPRGEHNVTSRWSPADHFRPPRA